MTAAIKRHRVGIWEKWGEEWRLRRSMYFSNRELEGFRDLISAFGCAGWCWSEREGKPFTASGKQFVLTLEPIKP